MMTKFRLKIDLSEFYDDERNLAYILVDPSWDQVTCLQNHVKKLFGVPEVQFLTSDGIYIPPRESIDVIKSNDSLRAIIPKTFKIKKKNKSSSNHCFEALSGKDETNALSLVNSEKRKCDDDRLTSTPNNRPKKKKRTTGAEDIKSLELVSNIHELQNCNGVSSTNIVEGLVKNREEETIADTEEIFHETVKSRKRKRIRKNKKSHEEGEKHVKNSRLSSVPVPISSSTLKLPMSSSTPGSSKTHIHFEDSVTLIKEDTLPREKQTILRCALSKDSAARKIEAESSIVQPQQKKQTIKIHEDIILVPAERVEVHNDCSVIEVDDSLVKMDREDIRDSVLQDITIEKILPLSEELLGLPNIGDIIIFKMYRISKALTPEISEYICGRCEFVDVTNETLSCLVLDGREFMDGSSLKLTQSDQNDVKVLAKPNCFYLFLKELLEKRVFRM